MISRVYLDKIGNLFLGETGNSKELALVLFKDIAKQARVDVTNLRDLKSNADAQLIIDEFYKYKEELTKIESEPITSNEKETFASSGWGDGSGK